MSKRWSAALVCLFAGATAGGYLLSPALNGQNAAVPAIPKELTSYRNIVKKVLPAVVSIEMRGPVRPAMRPRGFPGGFNNPNAPEDVRRFFQEFGQMPFGAGPNQMPQRGFGSGFVIDPNGIILTNNHVVAGAEEVTVEFNDGRRVTSRDFKTDRKTDLAIIRLKGVKNLPHIVLGDSDQMEIGDRVLAVGAPFGMAGSVTHGIISGKGRNGINLNMYEDFLQTDAAINPGNSGGPLVNLLGQAIGINAAIKTRNGGFSGIGLAIPSNVARTVSRALIKEGVVHRGYLGVQIRALAHDVAKRLGVPKETGVVVSEVFEDTPASKAGLKAGDVITAIGGKAVQNGQVLQRIVANLPLKKSVDVTVYRDNKAVNVPVRIEEQPEEFGIAQLPNRQPPAEKQEAVGVAKLGLELVDMNEEFANQLGYKGNLKGALISRVEPGSVAGNAGLLRGMLITRVDQTAVTNASTAREALDKASLKKGVLLQVRSPQGGANFVLLQANGG